MPNTLAPAILALSPSDRAIILAHKGDYQESDIPAILTQYKSTPAPRSFLLPSADTVRLANAVLNAMRLDDKATDLEGHAKADKAAYNAVAKAMGKKAGSLFGAKAPTLPELESIDAKDSAGRMALRAARFAWSRVTLAQMVAKEAVKACKVA